MKSLMTYVLIYNFLSLGSGGEAHRAFDNSLNETKKKSFSVKDINLGRFIIPA